MARIVWQLPQLLDHHGLKPRQVETEAIRLGFPLGHNTIYRLVQESGPSRIDLGTLLALIEALRSLIGAQVTVSDILEYQEDGRDEP